MEGIFSIKVVRTSGCVALKKNQKRILGHFLECFFFLLLITRNLSVFYYLGIGRWEMLLDMLVVSLIN